MLLAINAIIATATIAIAPIVNLVFKDINTPVVKVWGSVVLSRQFYQAIPA